MVALPSNRRLKRRASGTLARYVGLRVWWSMLAATALLTLLQVVFGYLAQISDLRGGYGAWEAVRHTLWRIPQILYETLPLGALIGTVMGLGSLATTSELVMMRASGQGVLRIVGWALRPALILAVLMLALAQWAVPPALERSENTKRQALGVNAIADVVGYWHRQGNQFAYVSRAYTDPQGRLTLEQTHIYQFDQARRLQAVQQAKSGYYKQSGRWQLEQIHQRQLSNAGQLQQSQRPALMWTSNIDPKLLQVSTADPDYLAPSQLYVMGHYLRNQGQLAGQYWLAFWQKMLAPFSVISMALVASAFIFGPLRSQSFGLRLVIALLTGLLLRYVQDFFGYASLIYRLPAWLMVALPIVATLVLGWYSLKRIK